MTRERLPFLVSRLLGWRPVRWGTPVGDYDGRDRTLHVFNADVPDQRRLRAEIDRQRASLQAAAGGPLVLIFHSVKQTRELYAEFARSFPRPIRAPNPSIAPPPERCLDLPDASGPHRRAA